MIQKRENKKTTLRNELSIELLITKNIDNIKLISFSKE